MSKILIGMAAAALWFVLSQAANAEQSFASRSVTTALASRAAWTIPIAKRLFRERDRGPGVELQAPSLQAPSRY